MGLMRGRKSGLWTGFFCGLLVDLFYGSVFGFYALIYMYVGFLSGYAFRIYYDDDIKVPMLLTAIMDFLYNLAVYALQFLLRGRLGLGVYFTRIIVPEIFYTVFLQGSSGLYKPPRSASDFSAGYCHKFHYPQT